MMIGQSEIASGQTRALCRHGSASAKVGQPVLGPTSAISSVAIQAGKAMTLRVHQRR